jgi:DNA-binding response OmpR family regulator
LHFALKSLLIVAKSLCAQGNVKDRLPKGGLQDVMTRRARIVILDDERDLGEALAEYLTHVGYDVTCCTAAWEFDSAMAAGAPDLLVLDLSLPGEGGLSILTRLGSNRAFPVIVLTGNQDVVDRVVGLEMGADDFVLKPVNPRELAARIAGLLNRQGGRVRTLVMFETTSVDIAAARLLKADGETERLSPGEIALIRAFSQNPGRVLTRDELLELAPAESKEAFDRSIDSRITRLRRKLATEALQTVRGRGYVFHPPRPGTGREG